MKEKATLSSGINDEGENDLFEDPIGYFEKLEQQQPQAGFQNDLVRWVLCYKKWESFSAHCSLLRYSRRHARKRHP